ncbi:MAG: RNase adapter RapZ [Lachnospiraceae bacterium]|nr:RNase adapter RapZ [Lachnospiraceae bacterium]
MRFVVLTGMSGAGKSTALKMLEDMGYFCADNIPVQLISKFAELTVGNITGNTEIDKVALGVDIRSGDNLKEMESVFEELQSRGFPYEIMFLDSSDDILIKRFKETRRSHPLSGGERVEQGIAMERNRLAFLKKRADYILDTSQLLTRELKQELENIFVNNREFKSLFVTILSFGFKYGIPTDSDLVFDVRFIPNPYYVDELKGLNGNDKAVQDFCMGYEVARVFIDKLDEMLKFLIPNYIDEGKNQLVIAIGCTGGKHRSVTLANELYNRLKDNEQYGIKIEHRDIDKDSLRKK